MIDDGPGERQQRLLAEGDVLREWPDRKVEHVAARSPLVRLGEKESLTLGERLDAADLRPRTPLLIVDFSFRGNDGWENSDVAAAGKYARPHGLGMI